MVFHFAFSSFRTRSVERLLESVTNEEQRDLIMAALSPGAVVLAKDTNGHRVVLYCLKHFSGEATKVVSCCVHWTLFEFTHSILMLAFGND